MPEEKRSLAEIMTSIGEHVQEHMKQYEAENDAWWNGLTEKEREDAFYAVVKRIYKAEIIDRGSYRYALYEVFGFDPGMYMMGMECGYMELHNCLYTHEEMRELRDRELASKGIEVEKTTMKVDFDIESPDPDKRSWYYDGDGTKKSK